MNRKYATNKFLCFIPADDNEPKQDLLDGCHFSQDTINGLIKLGNVLRQIHDRLIKEGYSIIDGRLIAPNGSIKYEPKRNKQQGHTQAN